MYLPSIAICHPQAAGALRAEQMYVRCGKQHVDVAQVRLEQRPGMPSAWLGGPGWGTQPAATGVKDGCSSLNYANVVSNNYFLC